MKYFEIEAISQSDLKRWLLGKNFAGLQINETKAMAEGSIFHALMAGEHDDYAVFDDTAILKTLAENANPRATKVYKHEVSSFYEANQGKQIVGSELYAVFCRMRDILYQDSIISKLVNLQGSTGEMSFVVENFSICDTTFPLAKGKMDVVIHNTEMQQYWIIDWKKTSKIPTPYNVQRMILYEYDYDFQAAWYCSLYFAHFGVKPNLLWVFIMDSEPYEYLIVDMENFLESGYEKIKKAIHNMQTGQSFRTMYGDEYGICRLNKIN